MSSNAHIPEGRHDEVMSVLSAGSGEALVGRVDRFVWKNRNLLAGLPLAFALLSTRWEIEDEPVIWSVAVALCLLGVVLRSWANCHCWYGLRRPVSLTTSGPYAYVRNPLYIANMLIITSGAVASELIWFTPFILGWGFLVYARVVRYEEDQLLLTHGNGWLKYQQQLPRWFPTGRKMAVGKGGRPFLAAVWRESWNFLILLPFLVKEINPRGLWPQ